MAAAATAHAFPTRVAGSTPASMRCSTARDHRVEAGAGTARDRLTGVGVVPRPDRVGGGSQSGERAAPSPPDHCSANVKDTRKCRQERAFGSGVGQGLRARKTSGEEVVVAASPVQAPSTSTPSNPES